MFPAPPAPPRHQVVTALISQPVHDPEEEQDCQREQFIEVQGRTEHDDDKEEVEELLLGFVQHVLLSDQQKSSYFKFDSAYRIEKDPDQNISQL